jgi:hypothetical protein
MLRSHPSALRRPLRLRLATLKPAIFRAFVPLALNARLVHALRYERRGHRCDAYQLPALIRVLHELRDHQRSEYAGRLDPMPDAHECARVVELLARGVVLFGLLSGMWHDRRVAP